MQELFVKLIHSVCVCVYTCMYVCLLASFSPSFTMEWLLQSPSVGRVQQIHISSKYLSLECSFTIRFNTAEYRLMSLRIESASHRIKSQAFYDFEGALTDQSQGCKSFFSSRNLQLVKVKRRLLCLEGHTCWTQFLVSIGSFLWTQQRSADHRDLLTKSPPHLQLVLFFFTLHYHRGIKKKMSKFIEEF